jgi:hypothetical protein
MADMDHIRQVEMSHNSSQVIGVMVHIVAISNLGGATMAAPVVRDHTIALLHKEQHLIVPIIG